MVYGNGFWYPHYYVPPQPNAGLFSLAYTLDDGVPWSTLLAGATEVPTFTWTGPLITYSSNFANPWTPYAYGVDLVAVLQDYVNPPGGANNAAVLDIPAPIIPPAYGYYGSGEWIPALGAMTGALTDWSGYYVPQGYTDLNVAVWRPKPTLPLGFRGNTPTYPWVESIVWIDPHGKSRITHYPVTGVTADMQPFVAPWSYARALWSWNGPTVAGSPTIPPSDNFNMGDYAHLVFQTAAGAQLSFKIYCPQVNVFLPDLATVNPSGPASSVIAALIGNLCSVDGSPATLYVNGTRGRKRAYNALPS